LKPETV